MRKKLSAVIPYIKVVLEELRRLFKKYEVPLYFQPSNILRQLMVRPKDNINKESSVGPVYKITCEKYLLIYRWNESNLWNNFSIDDTNILEVDYTWFEIGVEESIHVQTLQPPCNKDGGKYNLTGV